MELIKFTEANRNVDVFLNTATIFYFFDSKEDHTKIVSTGGTYVPVKEDTQTINKLLGGNEDGK